MKTPLAESNFRHRRSGLRPLSKSGQATGGRFSFGLSRAFSLVEVLAAIAVIGIITFLAIPNLLRIKEDGERNLAISRAETLNLAMASYVQANGQTTASAAWTGFSNDQRYEAINDYVAFAPASLSTYLPAGYSVTLPASLTPLTKATLTGPSGAINY